ncbi:MAG: MopE-related protein [Kofleriaceae bacterium]
MRSLLALFVMVVPVFAACSPTDDRVCTAESTDLEVDPLNCGSCGNICGQGYSCVGFACVEGACQPGAVEECYSAPMETLGVGPCVAGMRTCDEAATWSRCTDVHPVQEICNDGIDNDCNGMPDDDVDADGDGVTSCAGDCCDNSGICSKPELVNPGAFDAAGNNFDDDCNGTIDDTLLFCDQGLVSNSSDALDFARAIDICQQTTDTGPSWGVISAAFTLADGTGAPDPEGRAIRPSFGSGALPQGGVNLVILSTGGAAARDDLNPGYHDWVSYTHTGGNSSPSPADFLGANNGKLPNAPGCPAATSTVANDPVMLTLRIRVPTNARSFKLSSNFYSAEFPEFTCNRFNDFFVVLLDSTYAGTPANPTDKNLAFYQRPGSTNKVPVGVNLGFGNTGLFTQCVNGATGCGAGSVRGNITTCRGTQQLAGTGFDDPAAGSCGAGSVKGGATGWLVTSGNVTSGEIITLRIAIWDTSDHRFDSLSLIDGFQWSTELAQPGTVVFSESPNLPPPAQQLIGNVLRQ